MTKTLFHGTERNNFDTLEAGHNGNYEYYGDAVYFSEYKSVAINYGGSIWQLEIDLTEYNVAEFNANNKAIHNYEIEIKELINSNADIIIVRNCADNNRLGNIPFYTDFDVEKPYNVHSENDSYLYEEIKNTKKNREKLNNENINFVNSKGRLIITNLTKEVAQKLHDNGFKVRKGWRETPEYFDTYIIKNQNILNQASKITSDFARTYFNKVQTYIATIDEAIKDNNTIINEYRNKLDNKEISYDKYCEYVKNINALTNELKNEKELVRNYKLAI